MRAAALVLCLAGSGAAADEALFPAAQCAAFWQGYQDYLGTDQTEAVAAFRAVALRLSSDAAAIDAFIAAQRPLMVRMAEAYIYRGDRLNRRLFEDMIATCGAYAATQPETAHLP